MNYASSTDWLLAQTDAIKRIRSRQEDFPQYQRDRDSGLAPETIAPYYAFAEDYEARYREERRMA